MTGDAHDAGYFMAKKDGDDDDEDDDGDDDGDDESGVSASVRFGFWWVGSRKLPPSQWTII